LSKVSRPGSKKGPIPIPSKGSTTAKVAAKKKAEAAESKTAKSAKPGKPKTKAVSRTAGKKTTRVVKKK
jgi:hypothetical protein